MSSKTFQNHVFPRLPDVYIAFVQNNCCGVKSKAILYRNNLINFLIYRFIHFVVIDNRVKKNLLIIYSKMRCKIVK